MPTTTETIISDIRDTVTYNLSAIERNINALLSNPSPTSTDELRARAYVLYYALGFTSEAYQSLNALVAVEPNFGNYNHLGMASLRDAKYTDCLTAANAAISLKPAEPYPKQLRIAALLKQGLAAAAFTEADTLAASFNDARTLGLYETARIASGSSAPSKAAALAAARPGLEELQLLFPSSGPGPAMLSESVPVLKGFD